MVKRILVERWQCEVCRTDYSLPFYAEECEKAHAENEEYGDEPLDA